MQASELTLTLSFSLIITEGDSEDLFNANLEARRVRNEVNRLDSAGWDWEDVEDVVVENSNLVKNTSQRVVKKAFDELERYHEHSAEGWGRPRTYIHSPYPLRMNHKEGYAVRINDETGGLHFRVSVEPYQYVRGTLRGSPEHEDRLRTALNSSSWEVGVAEVVYSRGKHTLNITVSSDDTTVSSSGMAKTVVGSDINEDCIALAAMTRNGVVLDSVVIDYSDIKRVRHEYFMKRKRIQRAEKPSFTRVIRTSERDYVHDQLHKVSRDVVRWISQFNDPVLVFEDLKDMRDSIDYGTRMNRRLHSLPFAALRTMIAYKAALMGFPSDSVNPDYTSQRCPRTECLHTARSNRRRKRFKCTKCGFQDHADRKAAVCVAQEWFSERNENVPSLKTLPCVRKVRRAASGAVEAPATTLARCEGVFQ